MVTNLTKLSNPKEERNNRHRTRYGLINSAKGKILDGFGEVSNPELCIRGPFIPLKDEEEVGDQRGKKEHSGKR